MKRYPRDLVMLAADRDIEAVLAGLLARPESLRIRAPSHVIRVHPQHDPGCLRAHELLRMDADGYEHALVVLDHEGCGQEGRTREELEGLIEGELSKAGWGGRAAAIVIVPELEEWCWSESPHVDEVLGWKNRSPNLRVWLQQKGLLAPGAAKASPPKRAVEAALREARRARSSSIFEALARSVSVERCTDPSFSKLRDVLRLWFGTGGG